MIDRKEFWIQTISGTKFNLLDPHEDDVSIEDIAHSLSRICRFTGHTREHYSVAQHSVLVSHYVSEEARMWGLMHDAAEAYIGDLSRPLKQLVRYLGVSVIDEIEERIASVIRRRFGIPLDVEVVDQVGVSDLLLLTSEARDLLPMLHPEWCHRKERGFAVIDEEINPWRSEYAKIKFLERFKELHG